MKAKYSGYACRITALPKTFSHAYSISSVYNRNYLFYAFICIFKIRKLQFCRVPGGDSTAVTTKLNCTHCRSTSLQPNFNSWVGGGFDCSHCKVELHSLQINFTSAQLQLLGRGGSTAVTAKLNCTHCRSTSLQPNFKSWVWGGG